MDFAHYQKLARRTQNPNLDTDSRLEHALWGLTAEVGEVCGLFQKVHQGHRLNDENLRKEIGDVLWMIAELCDVAGYDMGEIAHENIRKLEKRYPNGFTVHDSINRSEA